MPISFVAANARALVCRQVSSSRAQANYIKPPLRVYLRLLKAAFAALGLGAALALPTALMAKEEGATTVAEVVSRGSYEINAGDGLSLQVWNEPTLSAQQLLVRPDGFISVPVIGEIKAGGLTVSQIQDNIQEGLGRYLKDVPSVVINVIGTCW